MMDKISELFTENLFKRAMISLRCLDGNSKMFFIAGCPTLPGFLFILSGIGIN